MSRRRTLQFDAVRDVVQRACDHPNADQILARVRERVASVSVGTVYRNLEKLAADGEIHILQIHGRQARYDGMIAAHDHFVCDGCGTVSDLLPAQPGRLTHPALAEVGYDIRAHTQTFFGLCPECKTGARA